MKRSVILGFLIASLVLISRPVLISRSVDSNFIAEGLEDWSQLESGYFTVYYRPDANLKRIYNRINTRGFSVARNPPISALSGPEAKLAYRLDLIFARVREILGMYPPGVHVNIKIFKNSREVNKEYCRLTRFGDECRSFYVYSNNTIYTSEQEISDSVLAHEMTHALVDHYFSTNPPEKVAEILAQNVDLSLDE